MTIHDVVSQFNTTPFLFAGSGVTRRYYGLPNWRGLLEHFAQKVRTDGFSFQYYENLASKDGISDKMPLIASYIENDFNEAWFSNRTGVRSGNEGVDESVLAGTSPFKAEVAAYIKEKSTLSEEYRKEVECLSQITKNNISGIITTNYDGFFEEYCEGYKVFIGQDELVFSQLQGVAEIYKIHGSARVPSSIVINQSDYENFKNKSKYLAAKLMTIFMEYPIVFIGYSLSDPDILAILSDILECLPSDKIETLQKRFVFIEYKRGLDGAQVAGHSVSMNGKTLEMTKISLSDFSIFYNALAGKKAAFPVKILRRFKDDLYTFVLTSEQRPKMMVAPLDDQRIDEETLALTIGVSSIGRYGLGRAVNADQWYRNIILHDLQYSSDDLLELAYPELGKQNSWKIPVWYYLSTAAKKHELAIEKAPSSYSEIVTEKSIQSSKTAINGRTIIQVWEDERHNLYKAIRIMSMMPEELISNDGLASVLKELFTDKEILSRLDSNNRSYLRRLIRIYDFLNWGKIKTP